MISITFFSYQYAIELKSYSILNHKYHMYTLALIHPYFSNQMDFVERTINLLFYLSNISGKYHYFMGLYCLKQKVALSLIFYV